MSKAVVTQQADESTQETVEGDCPECEGTAIDDGQETVCEDCGLVLGEHRIDPGPEWTRTGAFQDGERSRVGSPMTQTMHDGGLSTEIGRKFDAKGNALDGAKRARLSRMRRHHSQARFESKRERNRAHAFGDINRMHSALGVDDGRRAQACNLFKTAQEGDLVMGRSLEAMAAAAVYATARLNQDQLLLEDVANVARVDGDRIANAYGVLNRELEIPTPPPQPAQFMGRICSALDLGTAVRREAEALLEDVKEVRPMSGCKPAGIAAACVYRVTRAMSTDERPTQQDLAEASGTSDKTVRDRDKQIQEVVGDAA